MQAGILAGGKGTRLRPYTFSFPKPLVPIDDIPILEVVLTQLKKYQFTDIILSLGHMSEMIKDFCGNGEKWGLNIRYVVEKTPLNTAGALGLIENLDENFLVMNGDLLTTLDYRSFLNKHIESKASASVSTVKRSTKIDFGILKINSKSFLEDYIEKPEHHYEVSTGVYAINRATVSFIEKGKPLSMPELLSHAMKTANGVYCHRSDAYWLDIGRMEDYDKAQEEFILRKKEFLE